jgi:hypothetical protein
LKDGGEKNGNRELKRFNFSQPSDDSTAAVEKIFMSKKQHRIEIQPYVSKSGKNYTNSHIAKLNLLRTEGKDENSS